MTQIAHNGSGLHGAGLTLSVGAHLLGFWIMGWLPSPAELVSSLAAVDVEVVENPGASPEAEPPPTEPEEEPTPDTPPPPRKADARYRVLTRPTRSAFTSGDPGRSRSIVISRTAAICPGHVKYRVA